MRAFVCPLCVHYAGGQVYIDGTSPSYDPGVSLQLMGFRLFSLSYSPRLAISVSHNDIILLLKTHVRS